MQGNGSHADFQLPVPRQGANVNARNLTDYQFLQWYKPVLAMFFEHKVGDG